MVDTKQLLYMLARAREIVRRNPVAAEGEIKEIERYVKAQAKLAPPPELKQMEIPESQYTKIKGTLHGPTPTA